MNRFIFPVATLPNGLSGVANHFESLFDHLMTERDSDNPASPKAQYVPPMNVCEDDKGYRLALDLPGISADRLAIEVKNSKLTITGERPAMLCGDGTKAWREEILTGTFSRVLQLPELCNEDEISAEFENGVLSVNIPKRPVPEPKRINVRTSASPAN